MSAPSLPAAVAGTPFLDAADQIGCEILRDAVWSGHRCNWLVWATEPDGFGNFPVRLRAAAPDLYAGTAGIALFLARLAAATGDPHQRRAARGAAAQLLAAIDPDEPHPDGLFVGPLGMAWSLVQVGQALDDGGLIERGIGVFERASRHDPPAGMHDLMSGLAGGIVALVGAARAFDRPDLLEAALGRAERLVAEGQSTPSGLSWPLGAGQTGLLGLSHGTSGMALALFEAAAASGRIDLRDAGRACLAFERHHFDPERGAWPDYRPYPGRPAGVPSWPLAWCHGGIGIGLSRLRIRELEPDDAELDREIDAAAAAVMASLDAQIRAAGDFTPCHGLAGSGEFMLSVARSFGKADAAAVAQAIGEHGLERFSHPRMPWPCGVHGGGQTPSLMLGTAGIGLFYLRLQTSGAIPSAALPCATTLSDRGAACRWPA